MNSSLIRQLILTQWLCLFGVLFMPTLVRWLPYWQGKALYALLAGAIVYAAWKLKEAWDQIPR